jgi:hypothetical protein
MQDYIILFKDENNKVKLYHQSFSTENEAQQFILSGTIKNTKCMWMLPRTVVLEYITQNERYKIKELQAEINRKKVKIDKIKIKK